MSENFSAEVPPKSPDQKIAELDLEINKLNSQKDDILDQISQETEEIKTAKKKDLQIKQGFSPIEFKENEEVRQLKVVKDKKKNKFFYKGFSGEDVEVSLAEILTDMRWGIYYDLNHLIVSKAHNKKYNGFRQKYVEAYIKQQVFNLNTQELLIQRLEIDNIGRKDMNLEKAYRGFQEGKKDKQAGLIFERVMSGILEKMAIDLGDDWGFEFKEADVIDDVELKADCIMKVSGKKHKNQAVGVREKEEGDEMEGEQLVSASNGIQLTLRKEGDPDFERKKQQIAKIKERIMKGEITKINDAILLKVSTDNAEVMGNYKDWQEGAKQPGGPEKNFSRSVIIGEYLKQIFQGTELDFDNNEDFRISLFKYFEKNNYKQ